MNLIFTAILFLSISISAEVGDKLLYAIEQVESGHQAYPKGYNDDGKAKGWYQQHSKYWQDGCKFLNVDWSYSDAHNRDRARSITRAYLEGYGRHYAKLTGKQPTDKVYAMMHRGGPVGWMNQGNESYWYKVKRAMK